MSHPNAFTLVRSRSRVVRYHKQSPINTFCPLSSTFERWPRLVLFWSRGLRWPWRPSPQSDALKTGNVHKNSTVQTIDGPLRLTTDDNSTAERTPQTVHARAPTCVHTADASRCCTFFGGTQLEVGSSAAGGATRCIWLTAPIFYGYSWVKNSIRYGTMGGTPHWRRACSWV